MPTTISTKKSLLTTSNPELVRKMIQKGGYGTYRVILHPEWEFNLEGIGERTIYVKN